MNTQEKVISVIAEVIKIHPDTISLDSKLEDITEDSIKLFELFIRLEKEMNGHISYEEVLKIETIRDVIEFIDHK